MKKSFPHIILLGFLLGIAGIAGAYTPPSGGAFGLNTDGPLTISEVNQDKAGGLWVRTFHARGDAFFNLETFIQGDILGKELTGDGTTTVRFGGQTGDGVQHTVSASVYGGISVNGVIQSNSLATGPGGGKKPVCADANGTFFLCSSTTPPPSTPPATPQASGTLQFYLNWGDQTGTFIMIQSNSDGTAYTIEMPPGQTGGSSNAATLPAGTYTIIQSDIACNSNGMPAASPASGDQIFLSDGDFYVINATCN